MVLILCLPDRGTVSESRKIHLYLCVSGIYNNTCFAPNKLIHFPKPSKI